MAKKKCPLRKNTYTKNTDIFSGVPAESDSYEKFLDCIETECAFWSENYNICGLIHFSTSLEEQLYKLP